MWVQSVVAKSTCESIGQKQYSMQKGIPTEKDVTHCWIIQMPTGFPVALPPPPQA